MCALFPANIQGAVESHGSVQIRRSTSSQDGISNAAAYSMKFQPKNGRFAAVDRVSRELSQESSPAQIAPNTLHRRVNVISKRIAQTMAKTSLWCCLMAVTLFSGSYSLLAHGTAVGGHSGD